MNRYRAQTTAWYAAGPERPANRSDTDARDNQHADQTGWYDHRFIRPRRVVSPMTLFDPARHELLIETAWDEHTARATIQYIAAGTPPASIRTRIGPRTRSMEVRRARSRSFITARAERSGRSRFWNRSVPRRLLWITPRTIRRCWSETGSRCKTNPPGRLLHT